jgi:hypothetical protein
VPRPLVSSEDVYTIEVIGQHDTIYNKSVVGLNVELVDGVLVVTSAQDWLLFFILV